MTTAQRRIKTTARRVFLLQRCISCGSCGGWMLRCCAVDLPVAAEFDQGTHGWPQRSSCSAAPQGRRCGSHSVCVKCTAHLAGAIYWAKKRLFADGANGEKRFFCKRRLQRGCHSKSRDKKWTDYFVEQTRIKFHATASCRCGKAGIPTRSQNGSQIATEKN